MEKSHSTVLGAYCGIFAAVGYTAANICLRSVTEVDPVWVSCVKALPTVVLVGPWLIVRVVRNLPLIPTWRSVGVMVAAALLGQIGGNVVFQYALGVIGIAMTVPLTLGTMILGGALLGWIMLGEAVTPRMLLSTLILIVAICVLSLGAGRAHESIKHQAQAAPATAAPDGDQRPSADPNGGVWMLVLGVAAGCISGVSYALLGIAIRYASWDGMPVSTTLVITTAVGTLTLGAISASRIGWDGMAATTGEQWMTMISAGVWNALAFIALVKALQLTTVLFVNALNVSQAAMAAAAGLLWFGEPWTWPLGIGVALTAVGLLLMRTKRPRSDAVLQEDSDVHPAPVESEEAPPGQISQPTK